ncbi:unnamed protein product [Chilo suppressalis]|uniref:Carboxylesterase type B domain-containing protein n=1 Tax=Chilo suppressalis TaxID=168631 RepID=A0ABN8L3G4_CHISP|nr:unnamed protein product [Chilo suppressalis]
MMRTFVIYSMLLCVLVHKSECVFGTFTRVVETSYGKVRGRRSVSGQNLFYGIPYATSERFQPPKEPASWNGIFDAVRRFGSCSQTVSLLRLGSEDCLSLDLYVPERAKPGDKIPVLVFLHGGAYYYGSKLHYDPEFLVTKNVITAIINYRVGALGFLCLNGIANLGLKDQVAALKWIKKNIAAFGGDPDNVTMSGQSAGASAAAMHMLSESSKGLFHKLLLMSGSPLTPWAFNTEPQTPAFQDARKLTRASSEKEVHDFFAYASVDEVLTVASDTSLNPRYFKYSPCVDSNSSEPFFKDTPFNLIKSGRFNKVPILTGVTSVEGLLFYGLNSEKTLQELDEQFVERLPFVFSWCSEKDKREIANEMRSQYFGSEPIRRAQYRRIIDFYSDWIAYSTSQAFVDLMVKSSDQPVYSYLFHYEGDRNFAKSLLGQGLEVEGASHSDDIFYVFKPAGLSLILSSRDRLFIDRLTTMITNFMKYGNPTPKKSHLLPVIWPPANSSMTMRLDEHLSIIKAEPSTHQQFYLNLLCTYGQPGYVPCESARKCNNSSDSS